MIFQNEEFTELQEYPGYYISKNWVLIRETKKGLKVCSQTTNSKEDPYWTVTVKTKEDMYVKRSMHRLLMLTFVVNSENKAHVNHKNGDKSCREFDNLEWTTPKENAQHAYDTGLSSAKHFYVPVHQYNLDGTYIASYESACIAKELTGVAKQNISKCSLGLRDHAGGFIWTAEKQTSATPLQYKVVSHFNVTNSNKTQKKYKYIGYFERNPNQKKLHPLLKQMGEEDHLYYGKYFIERIYYK